MALNGLVQERGAEFKRLAGEAGFELAGVARAGEVPSYLFYRQWVADGMAGPMGYLTDRRAGVRRSAQELLPAARTVLCVGKLYNSPGQGPAGISRYAWGAADYHEVMRAGLERLVRLLEERWGTFESRICVDTAPMLERAHAHLAGLGWIGRNTCLINEPMGSWFFLGEILVSVELEEDGPPPDRCGTCRRCIDACPTAALVPGDGGRGWQLDARLCISTWTIEQRGTLGEEEQDRSGAWVFGCDICQEVCPWNRRAPYTSEREFWPLGELDLGELAGMSREEFRQRFRRTPLWRTRYEGLLRNVCTAMGNTRDARWVPALERLAVHEDEAVREHARWALGKMGQR